MDKLYPPAMTIWAFSFKARSDMLHKLQSKKRRNSDQCYCCLCPSSGLPEIWLHHRGLVFCTNGIQNKTSQTSWAKHRCCQLAMNHMSKDSKFPWEKKVMLYRNVRWKSSMLPFWSTTEAKYSPLCSTVDIKVRWWKGGEECVWISSLTELNVLYKWVGKASGKICPDLASFFSSFTGSHVRKASWDGDRGRIMDYKSFFLGGEEIGRQD